MSDKDTLRNMAFTILCAYMARSLVRTGKAEAAEELVNANLKVDMIKFIRENFHYDENDYVTPYACGQDEYYIRLLVERGYTVTLNIAPEAKLGLAEAKRVADYYFEKKQLSNVTITELGRD